MGQIVSQNARVLGHIPAEPPLNRRVTPTGPGQPTHEGLYLERNGADSHFTIRVPLLGILDPPTELRDSLQVLLDSHPFDPVSPTTFS